MNTKTINQGTHVKIAKEHVAIAKTAVVLTIAQCPRLLR